MNAKFIISSKTFGCLHLKRNLTITEWGTLLGYANRKGMLPFILGVDFWEDLKSSVKTKVIIGKIQTFHFWVCWISLCINLWKLVGTHFKTSKWTESWIFYERCSKSTIIPSKHYSKTQPPTIWYWVSANGFSWNQEFRLRNKSNTNTCNW